MNDATIPTPRTDAATKQHSVYDDSCGEYLTLFYVNPEDAQTLERELTEALRQRDEAQKILNVAGKPLKTVNEIVSENLRLQTQHESDVAVIALIQKEVSDMMELAEAEYHTEKIANNIVKLGYWKGELFVLHYIRRLLSPPTPPQQEPNL